MRSGELKIEGFQIDNLTPNGYDLTVSEIMVPSVNRSEKMSRAKVPPAAWFLIGTREIIEMPRNVSGDLWIKTSWARKGVIGSFGKIDAGFRGNLTLSAFNASSDELEIGAGTKFAQLVFVNLKDGAVKGYEQRSGNYQDQRGITLESEKD